MCRKNLERKNLAHKRARGIGDVDPCLATLLEYIIQHLWTCSIVGDNTHTHPGASDQLILFKNRTGAAADRDHRSNTFRYQVALECASAASVYKAHIAAVLPNHHL